MMIMQIVALRDIKGNAYSVPQFVPSIGSYLRTLTNEVNTPKDGNILNTNPEDFEAFHLGEYNDQDGTFTLKEKPVSLGPLSNFVQTRN